MKVILQLYDRHGKLIEEALKVKPREDVFVQALLGMRVPWEVIDKITIVIEFINMIPDGAMVLLEENKFGIYLRIKRVRSSFNETVAHELKHVAVEILRPKKDRKDGKKNGPYKWEEVNCNRAEKKWGRLDYFEFLKAGLD